MRSCERATNACISFIIEQLEKLVIGGCVNEIGQRTLNLHSILAAVVIYIAVVLHRHVAKVIEHPLIRYFAVQADGGRVGVLGKCAQHGRPQ